MGMLLYMMETQNKNNKAEGATKEVAPKPVVEEKPEAKEVVEEKPAKATRADIMKMNVSTVRAYAEEQGIEGANAISGAELKRMLVNKMFEDEE